MSCNNLFTLCGILLNDLVPRGQKGEAKAARSDPPLDSPNTAVRAPPAAHQHSCMGGLLAEHMTLAHSATQAFVSRLHQAYAAVSVRG